MAYTRYPRLRNYKKCCEIYTRCLELKAQKDAALEEANKTIADDDEFFKECDTIAQKYDPMIFFLRRLERYLEYPETKNEWFCGIVKEKGEGKGYTAMCPTEEVHIRFQGQWHKRLKLVFTQYIFVECELNERVYQSAPVNSKGTS